MTATPTVEQAEHRNTVSAYPYALEGQHPRPRLIAYLVALAVLATVIVGAREINQPNRPHRVPSTSTALVAQQVPAHPVIEAVWGLRFTNVIVLADNGGVELRYQVLDESKAAKIHQGDQTSNELPSILVEGTNARVSPSEVLMHFHHGDATAGRTYSIIYGNAGGVITTGVYVTIIMKDGLQIKHIPVSN